jgi:uncharacterized membrane protein YozB (DUF420 family)
MTRVFSLRLGALAAFAGFALLYAYGIQLSINAIDLLSRGQETDPAHQAYPPWTAIHFAAALLFAVLALTQLLSVVRRRHPRWHRYAGRVAIASGLVAAISGASVPFIFVPPHPLVERLYILVYFSGVAACLLLGFRAARRHDFNRHRRWMIRTVATVGAVMTQRLIFPLFFLVFGIHGEAEFWLEFVGAFALGWAINAGLAECWLRWNPVAPDLPPDPAPHPPPLSG